MKDLSFAGKRRNYFVDKEFQGKFILRFCLLVILGGILTVGILYLFSMRSTTVSIINSRVVVRSTADFLMPMLIQTVAIITVFIAIATFLLTLFISHKISGPIFRFKSVLESLKAGDFSSKFKIRRFDQFQDLALGINGMIDSLKIELEALRKGIGDLRNKVEKIENIDNLENNSIKDIIVDLDKRIKRFKT